MFFAAVIGRLKPLTPPRNLYRASLDLTDNMVAVRHSVPRVRLEWTLASLHSISKRSHSEVSFRKASSKSDLPSRKGAITISTCLAGLLPRGRNQPARSFNPHGAFPCPSQPVYDNLDIVSLKADKLQWRSCRIFFLAHIRTGGRYRAEVHPPSAYRNCRAVSPANPTQK